MMMVVVVVMMMRTKFEDQGHRSKFMVTEANESSSAAMMVHRGIARAETNSIEKQT